MANWNRSLIKKAIATKFEERGDWFDLFCKDNRRIWITPTANGDGYYVTIEKPAVEYWDSDYQTFIPNFKIETQERCRTREDVGEFIAEFFTRR
jgi:hypothetical protein